MCTALSLFWEHGYEATSVAQLAGAMGISMPSLYAAFTDKQALFDEAVELYQASPASVLTVALSASTADRVLETLFDGAAEEYTNPAHPPGCLVNSNPTLAAERQRNRDLLKARLQEAVKDGDLPPGVDPAALSSFAITVMIGMSTLARDGASRDCLQHVAALALAAVQGPRGPRSTSDWAPGNSQT